MARHTVTLDSIARKIAHDEGVVWHDLPDHPGFSKGRWRDSARWLIRRSTPSAVFLDGARQWNGKMSEDLVADMSDDDVLRVLETSRRSGRLAR